MPCEYTIAGAVLPVTSIVYLWEKGFEDANDSSEGLPIHYMRIYDIYGRLRNFYVLLAAPTSAGARTGKNEGEPHGDNRH
jgi:hypothetical protein